MEFVTKCWLECCKECCDEELQKKRAKESLQRYNTEQIRQIKQQIAEVTTSIQQTQRRIEFYKANLPILENSLLIIPDYEKQTLPRTETYLAGLQYRLLTLRADLLDYEPFPPQGVAKGAVHTE